MAPKEKVLHTRVPAVLEQELKKLAGNLRVPVSNVVRAILEDAVTVADLATKRTEDGLRSLDEVRDGLRTRLEDEKYKKALSEFLKKARAEADIQVDPKYRSRYVLEVPAS